jgi:hypothetical protein
MSSTLKAVLGQKDTSLPMLKGKAFGTRKTISLLMSFLNLL